MRRLRLSRIGFVTEQERRQRLRELKEWHRRMRTELEISRRETDEVLAQIRRARELLRRSRSA